MPPPLPPFSTFARPPRQSVLDVLEVPESFPDGNPQRAIYCSRTLNLRSIKAIGASGAGWVGGWGGAGAAM